MELKTSSSFKITGLLQPWQTLCKIFSKCFTTRVTGWDQPPLKIMQMMYFFVNNIHVDYAKLLWEGLYYSLHHLTSSIPCLRFTKIIISHYMTSFPEISRRNLVNVVIPRPNPNGEPVAGVGKVCLEYDNTDGSTRAHQGLNGRRFGGNQVVASFYLEDKFSEGVYDG
ncbi:retrovirus-related pol polyprotein from transposon TNT 1-94 [Tanacetum coccineum]